MQFILQPIIWILKVYRKPHKSKRKTIEKMTERYEQIFQIKTHSNEKQIKVCYNSWGKCSLTSHFWSQSILTNAKINIQVTCLQGCKVTRILVHWWCKNKMTLMLWEPHDIYYSSKYACSMTQQCHCYYICKRNTLQMMYIECAYYYPWEPKNLKLLKYPFTTKWVSKQKVVCSHTKAYYYTTILINCIHIQ